MKNTAKKGMKQLPALIFAMAGLLVLLVTGFLLSDPGRRFWEPQSRAVGPCSSYTSYPVGQCTNALCPVGRNCKQHSLAGAQTNNGKLCKENRVTNGMQNIIDCCPAGWSLNSFWNRCDPPAATPTPTPTATRTATPTPTPTPCPYGKYTRGTCGNPYCTSTAMCYQGTLTNRNQAACKFNIVNTNQEQVVDCCRADQTRSGTTCVNATTPTPTATLTPTSTACGYGTHSANSCTNVTLCTFFLGNNLGNKCASPYQKTGPRYTACRITGEQTTITDCCQHGNPVNGVCPQLTPSPTSSTSGNNSTPSPTSSTSNNNNSTPSPTSSSTHTPTATGTPTPTNPTQLATATPTATVTSTVTGTETAPPTPTITGDPTSSIPPTTSPTTNRTPKVTHTPSETGFAEDVLLYIGGVLYAVGVFAFIGARYVNSTKRIGK